MKKVAILVTLVMMLMIGMSVQAQGNRSYVIIANGNDLPADLAAQVAAANGTLDVVHAEIGLAIASSSNPRFANRINGVRSVVPNVTLTRIQPAAAPEAMSLAELQSEPEVDAHPGRGKGNKKNEATTESTTTEAVEATGFPPYSGDDDSLFDLQWGHVAVSAVEAWDAGVRGNGVRVAILDGGFDMDHPDLAPNINYVLSIDFTGEGIDYGPNAEDPAGVFCHGCHTAGTVGAADNAFGTIGVAPEVELVLVKVLENIGSGSFGDVISGILYAATVDADVINMSLGADIPQGSGVGSNEVAELRVVMNRAISFAYQQGTTVIVAAGNDARDSDHDGSMTVFPADMPHAIAISALGPINWARDPLNTSLDGQAIYTNFGNSLINFGAPGGDYNSAFTPEGNESCTVAGLTRPCYVFDFVFSVGNGTWYWSVGTSMAAPHAAGVAALIISENGGSMNPAHVMQELRSRSDDLGAPGHDPIYGHGRVNSGY